MLQSNLTVNCDAINGFRRASERGVSRSAHRDGCGSWQMAPEDLDES